MAGLLGIHLIGSGVGESIVIQLPNGKFGVVDCCCCRLNADTAEERLDSNPTLRFLAKSLHADSLAFVAFTHPHEDHGRGMSQILQHYHGRIDEIWIFDPYGEQPLPRYFELLLKNKIRLPVEKILDVQPGEFSVEVVRVRKLIHNELSQRHRPVQLRKFQGFREFRISDEPLTIYFLGPDDAIVDSYRTQLGDGLVAIVDAATCQVNSTWKPNAVNHNAVSPAILLVFERTSVLLGGDMESKAWHRVLNEQRDTTLVRPPLRCSLVKASHHGSTTGYCPGLYEAIAGGRRPIAILTPFSRHSHPLPQREGLRHIANYASEVLVTNREQAEKSTGADIRLGGPYLSPSWMPILAAHPEWAGVIDPSLLDDPNGVEPAKYVAAELADYLELKPELAMALRPELVGSMPLKPNDGRAEVDYRISLFFDAQGNEHKRLRFVGRRAGQVQLP